MPAGRGYRRREGRAGGRVPTFPAAAGRPTEEQHERAPSRGAGRGRRGRGPGGAGVRAGPVPCRPAGGAAGGVRRRGRPDAHGPAGRVPAGPRVPGVQHLLPAGEAAPGPRKPAPAAVHGGCRRAHLAGPRPARGPDQGVRRVGGPDAGAASRGARPGRAGRAHRLGRPAAGVGRQTAPGRLHLPGPEAGRGVGRHGRRDPPAVPLGRLPGGPAGDLRPLLPPGVAQHGPRLPVPAGPGRRGRARPAGRRPPGRRPAARHARLLPHRRRGADGGRERDPVPCRGGGDRTGDRRTAAAGAARARHPHRHHVPPRRRREPRRRTRPPGGQHRHRPEHLRALAGRPHLRPRGHRADLHVRPGSR